MNAWEESIRIAKQRRHPYAVFDMDFTLCENDTEITTEYVQVVHHLFWMDATTFTNGMRSYYPSGLSVGAKEAIVTYRKIHEAKEDNPAIRQAFRKAMFQILREVDAFPGLENCTFPAFLKAGLRKEEYQVFTELMLRHLLDEPITSVCDGVSYPSGLRPNLPLIQALKRLSQEGIAVTVVSASYEEDVKAMVRALGLEDMVSKVCAVKESYGQKGYILPLNGDPDGLLPWKEGKVKVIQRDLVPLFEEEPSFGFGDSNSDVPMLTSFPSMLFAGISPFANGDEMLSLASQADGAWIKGKTYYHRF